ncbi:hypothetical protein B1A99_00575 [Cohnella sp. CIP 111063]|uniref:DUF6199 family natural product biosynthesis protein n=1 Tax=unclassified Cohnella TaxID=2636738 RepID=UPI000B8C2AAF|nr:MULTISPECIES: DUF6199 family natural product biosynthesis protein [unclassified Cohnella]OXS62398.1 hypothetical protein B1A99_00575 [Cohnella sp. CIP 111063]PRX74632.1 hypothetical protein B0G52_101117 [Cohnella sp. SGD-V74]
MAVFIILFIILAILNIVYPSFGWYLRYGWVVKGESEPSEAYLIMSRVGGIVALVLLIFVLFSGAFTY